MPATTLSEVSTGPLSTVSLPALFSVLGPVRVRGVRGARKPLAVLTALLLHANEWVDVEQLIAATWQEQDAPASAEANLKTYIWHWRRTLPDALGDPRIERGEHAYRLRVEPGDLDVDHVELLAGQGRRARDEGSRARAAALFGSALELWRGRPFDGLRADSGLGTVTWLEGVHRNLRLELAELSGSLGRFREAETLLRGLVDEDPWWEQPWVCWMGLLCGRGRPGDAIALYRRARAALRSDLGVEPGPELTAAFRTAVEGEVRDGRR
ncbi:DNA-binding transcriptional activator of the SARP family [Amycolatopsis pretoriensis]|uniref:DNA-binding transcriptional activator of the SARP family n=1 Tax=Amycolatopsis pretoriensis TaxID=218821 RepID=A0A1H5RH48_9PSEU|nr:BTAD domain-containing putative transcriptional regulator [Amycolatopsis pretoriensis]SEF37640.1 DNA-binding transcriptional activator of the SARP family [Amycolatopsis pretoriensis]